MALSSVQEFLNNRVKNIEYFIKTGTSSTARERISWGAAGLPAAGVVNTTTIGGVVCSSSTTGALYYTNPDAGKEKKIFNINLNCEVPSYYLLVDRLWECSVTTAGTAFDITSSATQTINSVTWPARDINGSTNGEGIYIAAVSNGGWSSGVVDINISYTNSSGVSGRSGINTTTFSGNPTNATTSFISLDAGDTGVRSVQSLTLTFGSPVPTTGTFHLIAVRPICLYIQEQIANTFTADFLSHPLPKLQNNSCLTFITQGRAGTSWSQPFSGYIEYSEA